MTDRTGPITWPNGLPFRPPLGHVLCSRTKWRLQDGAPAYRKRLEQRRVRAQVKAAHQGRSMSPALAASLAVRPAVRP